MKTIYDRAVDRVREGDSADDMIEAGVLSRSAADVEAIRRRSLRRPQRLVGASQQVGRQCRVRRRFVAAFVISCALGGTAHAQPASPKPRRRRVELADRIQSGDRNAALAMIAAGADVNARAAGRDDAAALGRVPRRSRTGRGAAEEGREAERRQQVRREPAGRSGQSGQRRDGRDAPRSRRRRQRRQRGRADGADAGGAHRQRRGRRSCSSKHGADVNRREQYRRPVGGDVGGGRRPRRRWSRSSCRRAPT